MTETVETKINEKHEPIEIKPSEEMNAVIAKGANRNPAKGASGDPTSRRATRRDLGANPHTCG